MSQDFKPAFGLKNKHLQTIYSSLFTKNLNLKFEIEQFELPDGDFVDCYWYNKSNINQKIVVLFHGLAGSYKSPYIQGTMKNLEKEGFTSVIMHFRSCSGRLNKLPRLYHSGDTSDSLAWLKSLSRRFSNSKLYAVGYSLGGNILLKLLGEIKDSKLLCGAISISAPMELSICVNKLNSGFSKFYQAILLKNLNNILKKKYNFHDMKSLIGIDKTEIKQLKNFLIFDEIYTARIYGFKSAKDYYTKSSSKPYLKDISIPTLIIHSLDDPFMTPEVLPTKDEISSFVKLEISSNGGHLGFISGSFWNPSYYLENKVVEFFKTLDL
ncbi:MAG: hydrolase [Sulfurimonas sp.]|nr:MAG: hydrolase [Sulfurimonas sp.]